MYMTTTNGLKYHTDVSPSWDVCLYLDAAFLIIFITWHTSYPGYNAVSEITEPDVQKSDVLSVLHVNGISLSVHID